MRNGEKKQDLAIVMLSGGLDSTVALYWAKQRGFMIRTLGFNYYLRSRKEISASKKIALLNGVKHHEVNIDFLKEIDDLQTKRNPLLNDAEHAYIPSRNVIFYGIASSIAEVINARFIVGGHNSDDISNFPDSSPRFFKQFNKTTEIGLYTGAKTGRVVMPFSKLSKAEVIRLGAEMKVPFELTWSCYRSSQRPCLECHSCKLRVSAFAEAGIKDPLYSK